MFPFNEAPPRNLAAAEGLEKRTSAVKMLFLSIFEEYFFLAVFVPSGQLLVIAGLMTLPLYTTNPSLVLRPVALALLYSKCRSFSSSAESTDGAYGTNTLCPIEEMMYHY